MNETKQEMNKIQEIKKVNKYNVDPMSRTINKKVLKFE